VATPVTLGDIYAANRKRYDMGRAVGGMAGVTSLGERPGTTSVPQVSSWTGTAAGRARVFAVGAFLIFTFVHIAAEARFSG
jgi:hypothetical protein